MYSGIDVIEAEESTRPLIVGERTNVIGSRAFKNLVGAEQWEEAPEIARRQVKAALILLMSACKAPTAMRSRISRRSTIS